MYQEKLHQVCEELTQSEKIIADFFEKHALEARSFTSYQLAERLNIGQSTIIRFSKKLGYNSFRELLEDLSSSLTEEKVKEEIVVNEGTSSTNRKIIEQYQDMAELTLEFNPPQVIDQTVSALKNARKIIVFGFGNSNLFAEYISNQWLKMGLDSFCSSNSHIIFSMLSQLLPHDVLFLISESGETPEILKAARIAGHQKVIVIAMTRIQKNRLHNYSDIVLKTVNYETHTRLNAMTLRCSQLCLLDMIYLNLYKTDFEHYEKIIAESEKLLDYKYNG